jgi:hypothetical protein
MRNVLRNISRFVGLLSLVLLVLPSVLFLAGELSLERVKWIMLGATLLWFVFTPLGMRER